MSTQNNQAAFWRNFCMRQPRPALVRVVVGEDSTDMPMQEEPNWARVGETVAALEPDRVELYDEDMQIIRAEKSKTPRDEKGLSIPFALHADPNAAMLMHFSNLIARAYENQGQAFEKMLDIFQFQNTNNEQLRIELASLKQENEDLRNEILEAQSDALAAGGGGVEGMVENFINGVTAGKSEKGQPS